jgi:tetratricopeptide (TPR) repeat protein
MARGRYLEAIDAYRQAPANAVLWNKIGVAWDHLSAINVAKQNYERALALRPDYPDALNNLGSAWFELKNYRKALECYRHAFALNPHSAIIAANLGTAWFAVGKFDEGEQAYHTAYALDPASLDFDAPHLDEGPTSKRARARRDFCLAEIFAAQQSDDRAIYHLRRAFYEGFHNWKRLMRDPAFAHLRQTPEFARMMIGPGPGPGPA